MEVKTVYVTKEQMDASSVKAECLLLATKGTYYYGEAFQKFIEIEEWEYHRILGNPYLYYFSTALKKHFEWEDARRKGTTLAFSEVLGQTIRPLPGFPPPRARSHPNRPRSIQSQAPRCSPPDDAISSKVLVRQEYKSLN
jgi:hypothetical protein